EHLLGDQAVEAEQEQDRHRRYEGWRDDRQDRDVVQKFLAGNVEAREHERRKITDDDTEDADQRAYRKAVPQRVTIEPSFGEKPVMVERPFAAHLKAGDEDHRQRIDDEHKNRNEDDPD